jgi:hypothetical protein
MEEILDNFDLIKNYRISKINNIEIANPKYEIKYTQIYNIERYPEWTNIWKVLTDNEYMIDKRIETKINKLTSDSKAKYIIYEFDQDPPSFNQSKLTVGNISNTDKLTIKKNLILNNTSTHVRYEDLELIKNNLYDSIVIYHIEPIGNKLVDDRIEQKRLKINIDKLKTLEYLKNGGNYKYLITHFTIDATKDIIIVLSYLFEECVFQRPILHNFTSSATYINCKNFNKEKYNLIKEKLKLDRFINLGNIDEISSLGILSNNKDFVIKEIDFYSKTIHKIIEKSINMKKDIDISLVANIAYNINIPIIPEYIDIKYKPYNDLYGLCSNNDIVYIKTDYSNNLLIINKVLEIYLKNQRFGNLDFEYDSYVKYDLIIHDSNELNNDLNNKIYKLGMNKFLYIINETSSTELSKQIKNKVLEKVSNNIYKKISYISNLNDIQLKLDRFNVDIFDDKKYTEEVISKIIPNSNQMDYKIYSITLEKNLKINKDDKYPNYPYYPIHDILNNKIYLNPIHFQMINLTNKEDLMNTIKENIKVLLTTSIDNTTLLNNSDKKSVANLINQNRLIRNNIIKININPEPVPYYESSHGWLSSGTKSTLYAISNLYELKTIFEFGTWYGNSSAYIKKHNPLSHLVCIDYFQSIIESDYTIRGIGIDKFYIKYPRLQSVYKKMQKYSNVELIKGDALVGYDYLLKQNIIPDMIFIDFIKNRKILYNFLYRISADYKNTIIIGDDFVSKEVVLGVNDFMKKNQSKYMLIKNDNSYILVPIEIYKNQIEATMNQKNDEYNRKANSDLYYQCSMEIKSGNFKKAMNMVLDNKLDLNLKNKYIPNEGTLYHIFGYYLRSHEKKDIYLSILNDITLPKDVLNNYEFSFKDILRYDSSRLYS